MNKKEIIDIIEKADMVLVGLGEEFDDLRDLKQQQNYIDGSKYLKENNSEWLIPAWNEFCLEAYKIDRVKRSVFALQNFLDGKNYYIVSTSTSKYIKEMSWNNDHMVMPCGSTDVVQCVNTCDSKIMEISHLYRVKITSLFSKIFEGEFPVDLDSNFEQCEICNAPLHLNTVYTENYCENGYLDKWANYTKWLQGSLNKKLVVLELGVGLNFPSVIRWPFEKVAYFNKKAFFIRINEVLPQLTEELSGKGIGISENAIDWLLSL